MFSLNDENIKAMYNLLPTNKIIIGFTISQCNSAKFLQYYNTKQCKTSGSFPLKTWLIVTRNEFETFQKSCNPCDYLPYLTTTAPVHKILTHDPIKDVVRGVKKRCQYSPELQDEK